MELANYQQIESKIFTIRGLQVMLDRDLAELFKVETKILNQAVKRKCSRFPDSFRFRLLKEELEIFRSPIPTSENKTNISRSQIVTLNHRRGQHIKYLPFAFTE